MEGNLPGDFENGSNQGKFDLWKFELKGVFVRFDQKS